MKNKKDLNWFRKHSIWFLIISIIGWISAANQKIMDVAVFWFLIACIFGYYYFKDNYGKNKIINEKQNNKKKPQFLIIFLILFFVIFLSILVQTYKNIEMINQCKPFIDSQIPSEIIFDENYNILTNWTDNSKIYTLKDYRKVTGEGLLTSIETGDFKFRKGSKVGENTNKYYIETKIGSGSVFGGEINKGPSFYLKYEVKQPNLDDGTILPNKAFKIIPKNYSISKINNYYYFKFNNYKIEYCNNIN